MSRGERKKDPVGDFLNNMLKLPGYAEYYCSTHGKILFSEKKLKGKRPKCTEKVEGKACGKLCFSPDEWANRADARAERKRRVSLLRNHLEE